MSGMPRSRVQSVHMVLTLGLMVSLPFGLFGGRARDADERGRAALDSGDHAAAEEAFEEALGDYPRSPELQYNLGLSQYRGEDFERARATLEGAAESAHGEGKPDLAERALFGAGNALFRQGRYEEAIEAYDRALDLDPDDAEAQGNRALAERMLQEPPPPPPPSEQQRQQSEQSGGGGAESEPRSAEETQQDRSGAESAAPDRGDDDEPDQHEPGTSQRIPQPPPGIEYPPMSEAQAEEFLHAQRQRERMGAAVLNEGGDPLESDLERLLRGFAGEPQERGGGKPPW